MTAGLSKLESAVLPVGHPQVHPPLPCGTMGSTSWPGGVGLLVHEHVHDERLRQTEHSPVEDRRVLGAPVVGAPSTPAEVTHGVAEPLDLAVLLVLASLTPGPGESCLSVQPDDCTANLLRPLRAADPASAVQGAWRRIEQFMHLALRNYGQVERWSNATSMLKQLQEIGLGPHFIRVAEELRQLRNSVTHGGDIEITPAGALDYIDAAERLADALVMLQTEGRLR